MTAEQIQAIAAVATFLAAALAVWATFRAPRLAAQFAEQLRVASQKEQEARSAKYLIFANLMQFRSQMLNPNAVASLNLIDVVFRDAREVRDAWRHFQAATQEEPYSFDRIRERYLAIIEKIARDLGLSESITIADIQNSYYPRALGEADEAGFLELQDKLRKLRPPGSNPFA
jgi:hypothetical protein